jgi:hypothetical protein
MGAVIAGVGNGVADVGEKVVHEGGKGLGRICDDELNEGARDSDDKE